MQVFGKMTVPRQRLKSSLCPLPQRLLNVRQDLRLPNVKLQTNFFQLLVHKFNADLYFGLQGLCSLASHNDRSVIGIHAGIGVPSVKEPGDLFIKDVPQCVTLKKI